MPPNAQIFYKPVIEDWEQGDIIHDFAQGESAASWGVLLTPQCDIVYEKADYLLLILSSDLKSSFKKIINSNKSLDEDELEGHTELTKNQLKEVLKNILHHLSGASSYRFFYLPGYTAPNFRVEHTYLDFQRILTVSKETLDSWKEKRIANIVDPFRSQLLSRYVSYMGRVGAPDYQEEDVLNLLNSSGLLFKREQFSAIFGKLTKGQIPEVKTGTDSSQDIPENPL